MRSVGIALAAIVAAAAGFGASVLVGGVPSQPSAAASPYRSHDLGPDAFSVVACSTRTRCVAVGPGGWQAVSDDGGRSWKLRVDPDLVGLTPDDLACPTPRRCLAIATPAVTLSPLSDASTRTPALLAPSDVLLVSTDGGSSWSRADAPGREWLGGLSCPTAAVCYASAEARGKPSRRFLIKTSDGGLSWSAGREAPPGSLGTISCPSLKRCFAVGGPSGLALTTDGGVTWQLEHDSTRPAGVLPLSVIECAMSSRCVGLGEAVGPQQAGRGFPWMALYAVFTTDGGRSWRRALVQDDYSQVFMPGITSVGCLEKGRLCVAVSALGTIAVSRNGGLSWSLTPQRRGPFEALDAVTCGGALGCLIAGTALDGGGLIASVALGSAPSIKSANVIADATVASGSSALTPKSIVARLHSFGGEWTSLSCPEANHCVAVGGGPGQEPPSFAEVMTSSDGGWSWTEQPPPSGVLGLGAVDCPSVSRCYATGLALLPLKQQTILTNEIAVVLESIDGGRLWRRVGAAPGLVDLNAISCPEVATCFAAGDTVTGEHGSSDAVFVTTDGGARWHEEAVPAVQSGILLSTISCPSVSSCWVGGGSGLLATTDGGLTWRQLDSGWVDSLSCPSVRRCVAMGVSGGIGWVLVGSGLRDRFVPGSVPPFWPGSSEVCPAATVCIAAGATGEGLSRATTFVSHDGGRNWANLSLPSLVATTGGFEAPTTYVPWPELVGGAAEYSAIACPSVRRCVVLGSGAETEVAVSSRTPSTRVSFGLRPLSTAIPARLSSRAFRWRKSHTTSRTRLAILAESRTGTRPPLAARGLTWCETGSRTKGVAAIGGGGNHLPARDWSEDGGAMSWQRTGSIGQPVQISKPRFILFVSAVGRSSGRVSSLLPPWSHLQVPRTVSARATTLLLIESAQPEGNDLLAAVKLSASSALPTV